MFILKLIVTLSLILEFCSLIVAMLNENTNKKQTYLFKYYSLITILSILLINTK